MRTVNIAELKAHLSAHIQLVREGEEILVCDRNKPVTRIVPRRLEGHFEQEQRLVANGLLALPLDKRPASVSWPEPPGDVSDNKYGEKNEKAVSASSAFWDASALAPLCVRQSMTRKRFPSMRLYDVVVWWATPAEIASALARLMRMHQLNPRDAAKANNLAKQLSALWSVIRGRTVCGRRQCSLWSATTCGLRTLFGWRRRWNRVNTLLTPESF